ncbi:MAG: pentapeptide repeat-containing protein [Gammaproteobacteria bacterium]|nr:pentapeptide repeat-containing protein [Gammaproteobacteria bacterium]
MAWFVRRGSVVRGPFSSTKVRHFVLDGRLGFDDEVSLDREDWQRLGSVDEVVPLQMRSAGDMPADDDNDRQRRDRQRALRTMTVAAVLIVGLIGGVMWVGSGDGQPQRDCSAAPAPGVFLEGCDLSRLELVGGDLSGARLANTRLMAAKLSTAKLDRADMRYTDLSGADLSYASMTTSVLLGATLRHADLTNADLSGADLSFADLGGARLGGARLDGAKLLGAIWTDGIPCDADCPR